MHMQGTRTENTGIRTDTRLTPVRVRHGCAAPARGAPHREVDAKLSTFSRLRKVTRRHVKTRGADARPRAHAERVCCGGVLRRRAVAGWGRLRRARDALGAWGSEVKTHYAAGSHTC